MGYIENLKKKLEEKESGKRSGGRDSVRWNPSEGKSVLRILSVEGEDPFKEFSFHYNVGKTPGFLCPKRNFDEHCPVCEFASRSWRNAKQANDEAQQKVFQKLFAKERYFSLVLVRSDEVATPKWWGYSENTWKTLVREAVKIFEEDGSEVTDPVKGYDVDINYVKPGNKLYFETEVSYKRKPSKLLDDKKKVVELMDSVPSFFQAYDRKTPEEVQQILNAYLLGTDDAEEVSSEIAYSGAEVASDKGLEAAIEEMRNM